MKTLFFICTILLTKLTPLTQSRPDNLFFKDRLQPLSGENIFGTEGYYNWCLSIIKTGVAVAPTINGPWTRMDQPLIEPSGPIPTLTVNPAIARATGVPLVPPEPIRRILVLM